ncbi:MAG: hypothetical protein OXC11_16150 [Rhodospirillales bacterium]|nr:hypothetical protein [Rhodospirillales bacterium]
MPEPSCARLSDVLALVEPRLGGAVLDAAGRAALRYVADHIPARLSQFWGFEVRLDDPAPRADLLWEVTQGSHGIPTLAGRNPHDPAPGVTGALRGRSPFWRDLGRFAAEWLDDPGWLRRLGNIWMEVDVGSSDAALDAQLDRPSLFWGPSRKMPGTDRDLAGHLAELGRRFYGLEMDQKRIDAITDAVPEEGTLFQMGVMGARAAPTARLCVKDLNREAKEHWLEAIRWPGNKARLRCTLASMAPLCGKIALNVDVLQNAVRPKLGLEIYSTERALTMEPWRPILDALLAQGLVHRDKVAALAAFPSFRRFRQIGAWKRNPPLGHPVLATNMHHLKLVFDGEVVTEAKAYLGVFRPVFDYAPTRGHEMEGGGGWL